MQKFGTIFQCRGNLAGFLRHGVFIAAVLGLLLLPSLASANTEEAKRLNKEGIAKLQSKDFSGALADFNRAIAEDPKYPSAYYNRGVIRVERQHDTAGALADFNRAITADPKYGVAYMGRGCIAAERGDDNTALAEFNRALSLNSTLHEAYFNRGAVKSRKHDYRGALIDFNGALALKPDDADSYTARGEVKMQLGNMAGAMEDVDRAVSLAPKSAHTYAARSAIKGHAGDITGSLADADRAVTLDSKSALAYYCRGLARYQDRRWADAVADYRRHLELPNSKKDYVHLQLWLARARLGQTTGNDKELAAYFANRRGGKPGNWAAQIGKFLLGGMTREAFFAAADTAPDSQTQHGQQCEAAFYAGMKRLLAADKTAATDDFRRCVATKEYSFVEYRLAASELKTFAR